MSVNNERGEGKLPAGLGKKPHHEKSKRVVRRVLGGTFGYQADDRPREEEKTFFDLATPQNNCLGVHDA